MARTGRTFRVFVSSTFSDLKAERNALQERVFPKLKDLCMAHGCRLQAIDLRWGVSEEAGLDQKTMEICLAEIKRCQEVSPRPNFIVLLGDRYGWRPLPYEIPADEFEEIERRSTGHPAHHLLNTWYRRDDNAVPPAYVLLPRAEGTPWADNQVWGRDVEGPLLRLFEKAVDGMGLSPEARLKHVASATEQEIHAGALRVSNASEHVLCCFREIDNLDELDRDAIKDERARQFVDIDEHGHMDTDARQRLRALKEDKLSKALPVNIFRYKGHWDSGAGEVLADLDSLCETVLKRLSKVLLDEIALLVAIAPSREESENHRRFAAGRASCFIGRTDGVQAIREYLRGVCPHPLVVHAPVGYGKSSLLSKAFTEVISGGDRKRVMFRTIGATPRSTNALTLLQDLHEELMSLPGMVVREIPHDFGSLVDELPRRLADAASAENVVLFIDALDEISPAHGACTLQWIPMNLPRHVRIVVSTQPDECLDRLRQVLPPGQFLQLEPLRQEDGHDLLRVWLDSARRSLRQQQEEEILARFAKHGNPLYLFLAFQEACRWKSYDGLERTDLPSELQGIIRCLLRRLSMGMYHGEALVSHSLGLISASKNGLAEDELLDLLSIDSDVFNEFLGRSRQPLSGSKLPVVVWIRLFAELSAFLTERNIGGSNLIGFQHQVFDEVVCSEYMDDSERLSRHQLLSEYFGEMTTFVQGGRGRLPNIRKVEELTWHLEQSSQWQNLCDLLLDPDYLLAAWEHDGNEVRELWTKLTAKMGVHAGRAYASVRNDATRAWKTFLPMGELLWSMGFSEEAEEAFEAERERCSEVGDEVGYAKALGGLAISFRFKGEDARAQNIYQEQIRIYRKMGDLAHLSRCLGDLATIIYEANPKHGRELFQEQEEIARKVGDFFSLQWSIGDQAVSYAIERQFQEAVQAVLQAERICIEHDMRSDLLGHRFRHATFLKMTGRRSDAIKMLQEDEEETRGLSFWAQLANSLGEQAVILSEQSQWAEARRKGDEAEDLFRRVGDQKGLAKCLFNQAILCMRSNFLQDAGSKAQMAIPLLRKTGYPAEAIRVCESIIRDSSVIPDTPHPRSFPLGETPSQPSEEIRRRQQEAYNQAYMTKLRRDTAIQVLGCLPVLLCVVGAFFLLRGCSGRSAFLLQEKGKLLRQLNRPDNAIVCFDKAIDLNPKNAYAWFEKGWTLGGERRFKEALECFDKVLQVDPDNAMAWYYRGDTLSTLGENEEAIESFNKAINCSRRYSAAWRRKAQTLEQMARYHEAKRCYEQAKEQGDPLAKRDIIRLGKMGY